MRTSEVLDGVAARLRAAGLGAEADLIGAEIARVRTIETTLDAVLEGLSEPIVFPARRVPGLRPHAMVMAQAAD